jgi:hypothetical protein
MHFFYFVHVYKLGYIKSKCTPQFKILKIWIRVKRWRYYILITVVFIQSSDKIVVGKYELLQSDKIFIHSLNSIRIPSLDHSYCSYISYINDTVKILTQFVQKSSLHLHIQCSCIHKILILYDCKTLLEQLNHCHQNSIAIPNNTSYKLSCFQ